MIVSALVDVKQLDKAKNVDVVRHDLVALHATMTVCIRFDNLFVPDSRVVAKVPVEQLRGVAHLGSRLAGALPVGLAVRCAQVLEKYGRKDTAATVRARIVAVRGMLDAAVAAPQTMVAARAAASNLAYRAAGAVVVAEGGRALQTGRDGQRFVREALFTLVTGTVPPIKDQLMGLLTAG